MTLQEVPAPSLVGVKQPPEAPEVSLLTNTGPSRDRSDSTHQAAAALISAPTKVQAAVEYEKLVMDGRTGCEQLDRAGDYLPPRLVKSCTPDVPNSSFLGAYMTLITGRFLTLADIKSVEGIRQSVFDENVNLAVVSALLLTLVFPMFYESFDDYLDESFDGSGTLIQLSFLGEQMGEEKIADVTNTLSDLGHMCYLVSSMGFFFCTLASVYILLCVNEIGDDNGVHVFLVQMGRAVRLPYLFYTCGMTMFAGVAIRIIFTVRSQAMFVIEMLIVALIFIPFHFISQVYCVQCTIRAVSDRSSHEPLALTPAEVKADVAVYFKNAGPSAGLDECLFDLQARTKSGSFVPLSSVTTALVKAAFHQKMAGIMGLNVPDSAIYSTIARDNSSNL